MAAALKLPFNKDLGQAWIIAYAGPIPMSEKSMKKFENTTTIAKTPKSPGVMSRARTAVIKSCIRILEYFDAN